ncbi:MAG: nitroreductase family protein, partial [Muribaculaceae bacterium]|nr:nitroreductase family protein [Muribaculaceae bacterium]
MNGYDQLISLMNARYSCRDYDTARRPSHEEIEKVIEAARIAPSACNRQPWMFLVVENDKGRQAVIRSYERQWIRTAPTFIIALGNHSEAWHRGYDNKDHTDVDISIAVEHMC